MNRRVTVYEELCRLLAFAILVNEFVVNMSCRNFALQRSGLLCSMIIYYSHKLCENLIKYKFSVILQTIERLIDS